VDSLKTVLETKRERPLVKICGITNAEDALLAAEAGADLLGLIFVPETPRFLTLDKAQAITEALDASAAAPLRVGVFANARLGQMLQAADILRLDIIQLHGEESPELARELPVPVIQALPLSAELAENRRKLARYPLDEAENRFAWLLDQPKGAAKLPAETFNAAVAALLPELYSQPWFLAGALTPVNVANAIERFKPWGVDVCSGVERLPGLKDAGKMQEFVQAVHHCSSTHLFAQPRG